MRRSARRTPRRPCKLCGRYYADIPRHYSRDHRPTSAPAAPSVAAPLLPESPPVAAPPAAVRRPPPAARRPRQSSVPAAPSVAAPLLPESPPVAACDPPNAVRRPPRTARKVSTVVPPQSTATESTAADDYQIFQRGDLEFEDYVSHLIERGLSQKDSIKRVSRHICICLRSYDL